mmetsp:Transcript_94358/g.272750  ORF Transcript_94358/g.272750 Transcript_94358/m.272750 type:complete len:166 (+) Transcript_94358:76-573(+)
MSTWLILLALLLPAAHAFAPLSRQSVRPQVSLQEMTEDDLEEPKMNPNNPNLPELKGDFDWDAKFGDDDDWITENVPGKVVLNEVDLAAQVTALNKLEEKWRKERQIQEYEESRTVGWVPEAELLNGRFAMFFLATGLLTEYWTGVSMPGQVEEMLRIGGFIGFD